MVAALAGVLAVACSSAKGLRAVTPHASVPTAPAETTTTNPFAVPAVIDAAYVNRVLAALDAADGDITRMAVQQKASPQEIADRLKALYDDHGVQLQVETIANDARNNFAEARPNPGNQRSSVLNLLAARSDCIFAAISRDYSEVIRAPDPTSESQWVALVPLDPARDPYHHNPTGWMYLYNGFEPDHAAPGNPCDASS